MIHLLVAFLLSTVHAQTVNRDWIFSEELDPVLNTQVCRASTSVSTLPVPVELVLSFPKAFDKAPIIVLKTAGSEQAVLQISSRESEKLVPLQADVLLHVPVKFKKLVDVIESANHLPVALQMNGQPVAGRISLSGSQRTLSLVAGCLGVRETVPVAFFEALNAPLSEALNADPAATGVQLLDYVQQAFTLHNEAAKAEAALTALRAQMRPLLRREAEALRELAEAQAPLDRSLARLQAAKSAIVEAESRLALIPGEIRTLEVQKAEAEKVLAKKTAVFEPLRQQAAILEREVRRARDEVNSLTNSIADRRSIISTGTSQIAQLEGEADSLASRVRRIESELSPIERQRSSLQSDLNSYNVDLEKRRILNGDFRYQNLKRDIGNLENERRRLQGDLRRAENDERQAEQRLRQCQSVADRVCTSEQAEVNRARNEVRRVRNQMQNADREFDRAQWEMRNIENDAERRAIQGRDEISMKLRAVETEIQNLESERDRSQRRIRDIQQSEIPSLQNEIARARSELHSFERQLPGAQRDLNAAREKLATYKQSVDYDRIEAEFEAAKEAVKVLVEGITERQTEQRRLTRKLPELQAEQATQQREVDRRTLARDAKQAKVTEVQTLLKPQRDQETALAATLATWQGQFNEVRKLYQALVAKL